MSASPGRQREADEIQPFLREPRQNSAREGKDGGRDCTRRFHLFSQTGSMNLMGFIPGGFLLGTRSRAHGHTAQCETRTFRKCHSAPLKGYWLQ